MKKKTVLMLAVLTAGALHANATETAVARKTNSVADSLKSIGLQEAQVVSTRAGKHTPVAYHNLNKKDLQGVNFGKDVPYLLMFTPSVTTTSDAGAGIGYTGIRVRGTDATRINITANGVPINDSESNSVYWTNMGDFASNVENMQIQRGVGTSTNGSGAFGATINMQTDKIVEKSYAGIDLSAGSYASHKETVRFGTGLIKNHWGFQGRLSNIGSDGYIDRASTRLNSYFLQGGYFGESTVVKFITFNGQEKTYHAWNYPSIQEMDENNGRRYNSCGYMGTDENGKAMFYDNQTDFYHQQHYQLLLNQIINPKLNFNATLHYTKGYGYYEEYKRKRDLVEYGLATADVSKSDLIRRKVMDNDFYGAIASLNYDSKKKLRATLGGGWNRYEGDHYGRVLWTKAGVMQTPDHEYYFNKGEKNDGNIYGKVSYDIIKGLSVYVDLQYRHVLYKMHGPTDSYSYAEDGTTTQDVFNMKQTFDFFNPKVGLFYQINPHHQVYVSNATAHKEPTRNDYEDNLNTQLKAERLNDWELGYKYQSQHFSAGVNFYYMTYRDQFVLTGEINQIGEFIARNAGKSYRRGVELQAAWSPVKWFRWDANATWSHNRAKDWNVTLDNGEVVSLGDTPLSFSPDFIFNNIFTFDYAGFKASISSQYVGKQRLTNTGFDYYVCEEENNTTKNVSMVLKRHFITNLDLSYTFSLKGFKSITAGCTIYNLFSAKYFNNGWSAPSYKRNAEGKVIAYTSDDRYETGYAASAPINVMGHLSFNF